MKQLRQITHTLRQHLAFYTALYRDPRTPRLARFLLWAALAYTALPFDLIPDFLPVIGHLDDALIVPGLILLALWFVPPEVYTEHRRRLFGEEHSGYTDST
jgi:uncharacterized membrane protein YkvA (DUF1232 family)